MLEKKYGGQVKKRRRGKNKKKKGTQGTKRDREEIDPATLVEPVQAAKKSVSEMTDGEKEFHAEVFTSEPFASLSGLSEPTFRALKRLGFDHMTRIQKEAIPAALSGRDVLIHAKTGHGKTLAFGIPLFESLLGLRGSQAVVICPTRELALQTERVFLVLAHEHNRKLSCFIGGTNVERERRSHHHERPDVLIATPGRLVEHLRDNSALLDQLLFLVLDEADRLLDEGFQRDMQYIFKSIPSVRRTILASATMPQNLSVYRHLCLREGYARVSSVAEHDLQKQGALNGQLQERMEEVTSDQWLPRLLSQLQENAASNWKTLVFFQAAQQTRFAAFLLSHGDGNVLGPVYDIHSRMTQSKRTKHLDSFRKHQGKAILCSSDVGARGWDIQGIDMVIQVGIPSDNETYIHRVGRTARAGQQGASLLLSMSWETKALLKRFPRAQQLMQPLGKLDREMAQKIILASTQDPKYTDIMSHAYSGFLGYHNSIKSKYPLTSEQCVSTINKWIQELGAKEPPYIEERTVMKMGLKGVPGLKLC